MLWGAGMRRVTLPLVVLVAGAAVAAGPPAGRPGATIVRGFFDGGWPGPSGVGQPGVTLWASPLGPAGPTVHCEPPVDSAVTDSSGWFRLELPAAVGRHWMLCVGGQPGSRYPGEAGPGIRLHVYRGPAVDSLRLYCRGHGPTGSPECRPVPWDRPFRWPGTDG